MEPFRLAWAQIGAEAFRLLGSNSDGFKIRNEERTLGAPPRIVLATFAELTFAVVRAGFGQQ